MRCLAAVMCLVLMLTACASNEATPVTTGFQCVVDVDYDGALYQGTLEVHDVGDVVLVLTQPETVKGLMLSFSDEQLAVSYAGMTLALSDTQIPAAAVVRLLGKTLEQAAQQASPSSSVQGELDGVSFELEFDQESGMPLSLCVPAYALTVTFSAWQIDF